MKKKIFDLNTTLFISDYHFGDENIIRYFKRPFKNVDEMNNIMIEKTRKMMNENITLFILGDFGKIEFFKEFAEMPHKEIYLIKGNHDNLEYNSRNRNEFFWYTDNENRPIYNCHYSEFPIIINDGIVISHEPLVYFPPESPYLNIHGHIHNLYYGSNFGKTWKAGNRYFNASIENIDYHPISLRSIFNRMGISYYDYCNNRV